MLWIFCVFNPLLHILATRVPSIGDVKGKETNSPSLCLVDGMDQRIYNTYTVYPTENGQQPPVVLNKIPSPNLSPPALMAVVQTDR